MKAFGKLNMANLDPTGVGSGAISKLGNLTSTLTSSMLDGTCAKDEDKCPDKFIKEITETIADKMIENGVGNEISDLIKEQVKEALKDKTRMIDTIYDNILGKDGYIFQDKIRSLYFSSYAEFNTEITPFIKMVFAKLFVNNSVLEEAFNEQQPLENVSVETLKQNLYNKILEIFKSKLHKHVDSPVKNVSGGSQLNGFNKNKNISTTNNPNKENKTDDATSNQSTTEVLTNGICGAKVEEEAKRKAAIITNNNQTNVSESQIAQNISNVMKTDRFLKKIKEKILGKIDESLSNISLTEQITQATNKLFDPYIEFVIQDEIMKTLILLSFISTEEITKKTPDHQTVVIRVGRLIFDEAFKKYIENPDKKYTTFIGCLDQALIDDKKIQKEYSLFGSTKGGKCTKRRKRRITQNSRCKKRRITRIKRRKSRIMKR